jgi:hypothetical protein
MDIHKICIEYKITDYTINEDGSIDVNNNVDLGFYKLTELPLVFNKVTGYFSCTGNYLTSLKGSPRWVGEFFDCEKNKLTSLEFSPYYVGDDFYCESNLLTDNISDSEISGYFYTSLDQDGLIGDYYKKINYNEWRKLYKRKIILNELYTRHM